MCSIVPFGQWFVESIKIFFYRDSFINNTDIYGWWKRWKRFQFDFYLKWTSRLFIYFPLPCFINSFSIKFMIISPTVNSKYCQILFYRTFVLNVWSPSKLVLHYNECLLLLRFSLFYYNILFIIYSFIYIFICYCLTTTQLKYVRKHINKNVLCVSDNVKKEEDDNEDSGRRKKFMKMGKAKKKK